MDQTRSMKMRDESYERYFNENLVRESKGLAFVGTIMGAYHDAWEKATSAARSAALSQNTPTDSMAADNAIGNLRSHGDEIADLLRQRDRGEL